ncbi:MAG: hypothetical protein IJA10_15705 [Lachnospiraceae bacterium]|nr:hypothetical protein [Lachnospiraceae bacterium]
MKKRKPMIIITIIVLGVAVTSAGILYFVNRDRWFHKEKPITDVVVDGDVIEFNVNRKFYLYEENPLGEKAKDVKPLKEVAVVMKGNADFTKENFEGEVSVEGFELSGNTQVYSIEKDTTKSEYEYMMFAVGLNGEETVEKPQYGYRISITEDFKVINIWIFDTLSDDEKFYWAVNEGY